jgi:hypothetical protein
MNPIMYGILQLLGNTYLVLYPILCVLNIKQYLDIVSYSISY